MEEGREGPPVGTSVDNGLISGLRRHLPWLDIPRPALPLTNEELTASKNAAPQIEALFGHLLYKENLPKGWTADRLQKNLQELGNALTHKEIFVNTMFRLSNPILWERRSPIKDTLPAFIAGQLSLIEPVLDNNDKSNGILSPQTIALGLIVNLLEHGSPEQKQKATGIIDQSKNLQKKYLERSPVNEHGKVDPRAKLLAEYLKYKIYHCSDEDTKRSLANKLARILRHPKLSKCGMKDFMETISGGIVRPFLGSDQHLVAQLYLETIMAAKPKEIKDIANSWLISNARHSAKSFTENVRAVRALEKWRPGSAALLYRKYGITHFGRYPQEALKNQARGNKDMPSLYGVIISAYKDHNNTFLRQNHVSETEKLQREAKKMGIAVIFAEARGKITVARRIKELYDRHGKRSFLIIYSHGLPESIIMGPCREGKIELKDLSKSRRLRQTSRPGGPVIVSACSTGKKGGFAQELSRTLQTTVIGPDGVANSEIILQKKNGNPTLAVRYKNKAGNPVRSKAYRQGKLVA